MSGCIRISFVNLAKVSGFETELDSLQQKHVTWISDNDTLDCRPNDGNIYAVSANQLYSIIKRYPQSMVYLWTPTCTGRTCLPLSSIQQQCDQKGLELFVVATSSYGFFDQNMASINHPVHIPNEHSYKEKDFEKIWHRFVEELLGEENYNNIDSLWVGKFIYKEGEFVGIGTHL